MPITITVDSSFLASPPDTGESPEIGALRIRQTRTAYQERLAVEHIGDTDETQSKHGLHRPGSGMDYYIVNTTLPTTRPDGVTALNVDDKGRVCYRLEAPISADTADGTTTDKLVDSGATFITDDILVGMSVWNTTDNTRTTVTAVDSETQLTLEDDIFVSGEAYQIYASMLIYVWDGYAWIQQEVVTTDRDTTLYGDITINKDLSVTNNISLTGGITQNSVTLKTKVLEIGDWNMDSTSQIFVAHGLTFNKIRHVSVIIRDDTESTLSLLTRFTSVSTGTQEGGVTGINTTTITLNRRSSGLFDNTAFDSTGYNRGWITIQYEV